MTKDVKTNEDTHKQQKWGFNGFDKYSLDSGD